MSDFSSIAAQFVTFYYQNFDTQRSNLGSLYRENSMLTFESSQHQGIAGIVGKLTSLPFQKVAHEISTIDAQPASPNGDIIVLVTGSLLVDDEKNPLKYTQVFHLVPENDSYFVFNDIFKMVY
ncbi:uncharacterized protein SAPINGB_P004833 [Magnusiomyces paraingens]|uniref:Nuclear transport factor 2 n=1 Tax=Magnusiomyces paraingens TaxID=2606893 RepID=A0A5E8BYJ7_9ASCO|nr:uncharacterized protein SAPINGB_P004833 [Saprochaete ingens]VVT56122.1 unnamed protein product [Saprochaete ingens]